MVALLKLVRDNGGWEELGYGSFKDYVENEDLSFNYNNVRNYITTLDQLEAIGCSAQSKLKEIPYSKVRVIAPFLTPTNTEDWFSKAESLSWRDLYLETKEIKRINQPEEESANEGPITVQADIVWRGGKATINIPPENIEAETLKRHYEYYKEHLLVKQEYGNPDINTVIAYLKETLGLPVLDGSVKTNRQYAKHLLSKFGGVDKVKLLIDATAKDEFWKYKIASCQQLYYKGVQIASKTRDQKRGLRVVRTK